MTANGTMTIIRVVTAKGSRTKKKLADFETFAQIWVGGSGKTLI